MLTEKEQKVAAKFCCKNCDYVTSRKSNWAKHLSTAKHKMLTNANKKEQKVAQFFTCTSCRRKYRHRSSLCRHSKVCKGKNTKVYLDVQEIKKNVVEESPTIIGLLKELIKGQKRC